MSTLVPLSRLLASQRQPDIIVARGDVAPIRWQEFSSRVQTLSTHLQQSHSKRWLLGCTDAFDFACGFFALMHAGKEIVIPPSLLPEAIENLKSEYEERLVALPPVSSNVQQAVPRPLDAHAVRIDLYTSGSTGTPQKIEKTLAQLEAEVNVLENSWGRLLADAAIVANVPHHHIYGLLFRLLWPLAAGRIFDSVQCGQPHQLLERLELLGKAAIVSSPAQLNRMDALISLEALKPNCCCLFSSGGPLNELAAESFHRVLGFAPLEIYGSTETGGIAWRQQANGETAWTPLPGIEIGSDDSGALKLRSPFAGDGNWFNHSDRIELLPDGRFHLMGRMDRVVKVEEKRLFLPDMEARLRLHPWVTDAGIALLEGRRQVLGAAVVLNPDGLAMLESEGKPQISQALRQDLGRFFDAVLLPRKWRFVENLPLNERGKLTAAALADLFSTYNDS